MSPYASIYHELSNNWVLALIIIICVILIISIQQRCCSFTKRKKLQTQVLQTVIVIALFIELMLITSQYLANSSNKNIESISGMSTFSNILIFPLMLSISLMGYYLVAAPTINPQVLYIYIYH